MGLTTGGLGVPEYRENPTSFLLIAVMDLGVFTPAAIAAGFGLRRGHGWAKNVRLYRPLFCGSDLPAHRP